MNTGELHEYLVNEIVEFILDRADINTIEDIENFWDHYFDEHYMSNSVWEAKAVINIAPRLLALNTENKFWFICNHSIHVSLCAINADY